MKRKRTRRSRRSSSGQTERLHIQDKAERVRCQEVKEEDVVNVAESVHECVRGDSMSTSLERN